MSAAASTAASPSSTPARGAIPRARRSSASASGNDSGRAASTHPRAPVRQSAASKASKVMCHSRSVQRSRRGGSMTRSPRSNPHPSMAAKVAAEALRVPPDEGVVVEGVGDGDEVVQGRAHPVAFRPGEGSGSKPPPLDRVRHERRLAARAAQRGDLPPAERPSRVQQLQGLEEGGKRVRKRDPGPPEEGARALVRPGERGGVRHGEARPFLAPAELAGDEGDALLAGLPGGRGEGRRVLQRLDEQADGGDPAVFEKGVEHVRGADAGAVPEGHHRRDRHRPEVHGEGDREVAALREDRDPTVAAHAPVLVGPERGAVEVVDEAVAVGTEDRHVSGRFDERRLESRSRLPRLGEARGVAHRAPRPPGGERPHHVDRAVAAHAHEGGVRRLGQVLHRTEAGQPRHLVPRRMYRVDRAREAHAPALLDDPRRLATADRADRAGIEEAREIGGHGRDRKARGGPGNETVWRGAVANADSRPTRRAAATGRGR